jgi:6,7-dimethyl-8-ribityllumazine synthase
MNGIKGHDLSGIQYTAGKDHSGDRIAIVVSKWNSEITEVLNQGALDILTHAGVRPENIRQYYVPGSYELPFGAQVALEKAHSPHGVICLGCVIQGETRHFDFISQAVSMGIMDVGLKYNKPVILGVLTPDNLQQAKDRAGGKFGNKGMEAAVALLDMLDLIRQRTV